MAEYKGYHIEETLGRYRVYKSYEAWVNGEEPLHQADSLIEAKLWIDQPPLERVKPFLCPKCGKMADKVVVSFAVLKYNETTEDYTDIEDIGDAACVYCGEPLAIVRFYPPEKGEEPSGL